MKPKNRFSPWRSSNSSSSYLNQPSPIPNVVELNTGPTCNRKCSFCPRAEGWSEPGDYFEIALANKIAQELYKINFCGLVQFTGYGEPLQHPNIFDLIEVFSRKKIQVELTTNGDFLKRDIARQLSKSGLAFLRVSLYDNPRQVKKFKQILDGISFDQVKLIERWDADLFDTKTNRAGYLHDSNEVDIDHTVRPCNYPFYHMLINHTGEVYLCPQDWSLKYSLGNVKESSIMDIWLSEEYQNYRAILATNRGIEPCLSCDADGLVYGNQSRLSWISENSHTLSAE